MAALTLVNTAGGNVVAYQKWLTHQATANEFEKWSSKIPGMSAAVIKVAPDGTPLEEFRVTTHKHLRSRVRIANNRTSTEVLKGYGVNLDTSTVTGVRIPLAQVVDLDEHAQTLTQMDLSEISVKELGLICGRIQQDIIFATLSAGAMWDSTNGRISYAACTTAQYLMDQLKALTATGSATYPTAVEAARILNLAGIGTDDVTSSHTGYPDYRAFNAFFINDGAVRRPSEVISGSMWDQTITDVDSCKLSYSALADLSLAADDREIPPLEGGIMGELGPYRVLMVPRAVFNDLLNDPDREEAMFNLGMRTDGLKEWSARHPEYIFHRGILVVKVVNNVDAYSSDCIATPANGLPYPLRWPGVAVETSTNSGKYVVECPLLGAQCLGTSQANKQNVKIGESDESDGKTKPWLYGKFTMGAVKTTQMMPDGVYRYRSGSVICTTQSAW